MKAYFLPFFTAFCKRKIKWWLPLGYRRQYCYFWKSCNWVRTPPPLSFAQKQTFSWCPLGPDKSIFHFPLKAFTICLLNCRYWSLFFVPIYSQKSKSKTWYTFPSPYPTSGHCRRKSFSFGSPPDWLWYLCRPFVWDTNDGRLTGH